MRTELRKLNVPSSQIANVSSTAAFILRRNCIRMEWKVLRRHAVNEYEGWVKIVIRFRLSHKPRGIASIETVAV